MVLVSAGIGLTPMISMLHELADDPLQREIWFIHGTRNKRHHVLGDEVAALAERSSNIHCHTSFSRPSPTDIAGQDYDSAGRVDPSLIVGLIETVDADFYLCGPTAFLVEVAGGLEALGVPSEQIRSETF